MSSKKTPGTKQRLIIVVGLLLLAISCCCIASLTSEDTTKKLEEINEDIEDKTEGLKEEMESDTTEEETEPESNEDPISDITAKVREYVEKRLGKDRVREIDVNPRGDAPGYIVWIYFDIAENFTEKMIKEGAIFDSVKMFNQTIGKKEGGVFQINEEITKVGVLGYLELVDVKGNVSESKELQIEMDRDTYESINWENFLPTNISLVADKYYEGSYLKKIEI